MQDQIDLNQSVPWTNYLKKNRKSSNCVDLYLSAVYTLRDCQCQWLYLGFGLHSVNYLIT